MGLWYAATASIPDSVWETIAHLDVSGVKPNITGSQSHGILQESLVLWDLACLQAE